MLIGESTALQKYKTFRENLLSMPDRIDALGPDNCKLMDTSFFLAMKPTRYYIVLVGASGGYGPIARGPASHALEPELGLTDVIRVSLLATRASYRPRRQDDEHPRAHDAGRDRFHAR